MNFKYLKFEIKKMPKNPVKLQPGVKYGKLKKAANMKSKCEHSDYIMADSKMLCKYCKKLLSDDPIEIATIKTGYELNPQAMMLILNEKFTHQ